MKWVVEELGFEEVQRRILKHRTFLLASATWPGGIPETVRRSGDLPAGTGDATPTAIGQGTSVSLVAASAFTRWESANVVRGAANGTVSAHAWARLGDITAAQFHALATIQRELEADVRVTNRQNFVFRGLTEQQLPRLHEALATIDMAEAGAELSRDVVACPGADTGNLAVTQSRGLADAIGARPEEEGLAEVGSVRTNISGCTNSCGQHHIADIGFFGAERPGQDGVWPARLTAKPAEHRGADKNEPKAATPQGEAAVRTSAGWRSPRRGSSRCRGGGYSRRS